MDDLNPKKRGLGRGLGALFEDEEVEYTLGDRSSPANRAPGNKLQTLGVDQLYAGAFQPRQTFNEEDLDELAASIRAYGLLQPILVRPAREVADNYEIIAGERRWRAAQRASIHDVPVIIKELDDFQALEIGLIENLQRADLNVLEEARAFHRLIEDFKYTHGDIAERVGKSRSYITNLLRLMALPPKVQDMLTNGAISAGHARALVSAENPEALAKRIQAENLSVREVERLIAAEKSGDDVAPLSKSAKPSGGGGKDSDTLALERQMSDHLGMRVTIDAKGTKGAVRIEFKDLDQLDDLLGLLSETPKVRLQN